MHRFLLWVDPTAAVQVKQCVDKCPSAGQSAVSIAQRLSEKQDHRNLTSVVCCRLGGGGMHTLSVGILKLC